MTALTADHVVRHVGSSTILRDVSLTVDLGERIGLIGANGSGKSTLARILAGLEPPDQGTVARRRGLRCMLLPQEPVLAPDLTVFATVESGLDRWRAATERFAEVSSALDTAVADHDALLHEQAELAARIEALGGWDARHRVEAMLQHVGLTRHDALVGTLSGGERRRTALAQLLVAAPDIAILDEPTNHLDADTIAWLEEFLTREYAGALITITHDRYLLDRAVTRMVELDLGTVTSYPGRYRDYLVLRAEKLAAEARVEAKRVNTLRRETEWLSRGPAARTTKQRARIERAEELAETVSSSRRTNVDVNLAAAVAQSGRRVLEFRGASVTVADRTLVRGLDLVLAPGERLGIVGANGTGKTSLLRAALGEIEPSAGEVIRPPKTRIAYFDQTRGAVDLDRTVIAHVTSDGDRVRVGDRWVEPHAWLDRFGFDAGRQRQSARLLSGGERARLALAVLLRGESNLLLLDEPTNDLDLATLAVLEDFLLDWTGAAIIVSHDRYFLDRVATSILSFEGDGETVHDRGDWEAHLAARDERRTAKRVEVEAPRKEAPRSKAPSDGPKPLTPPELRELDGLMDRIDAAESEVHRLETALADPGLYARGGGADVQALIATTEAARATVQQLLARWEALELRRGGR